MLITGLRSLATLVTGTSRDLAPIVLVVAFFQAVVLRQPFPNLADTLVGLLLVMLGWVIFRADSVSHALEIYAAMFSFSGFHLAPLVAPWLTHRAAFITALAAMASSVGTT